MDWTLSAFNWRRGGVIAPTMETATVLVVASAEACSVPGTNDCALTVNSPVLKTWPVGPLLTEADRALLVSV